MSRRLPIAKRSWPRAESEHQHKKQSGGRGQYAKVHLRIFPLKEYHLKTKEDFFEKFANKAKFEKIRLDSSHYDPDYNFGFVDHIVGGTIPINFIPAVEKGCKELLDKGALAGYRIEDVAVEVYFGKYHDVDSSEAAFKTAGRMAMKKAFLAAHPGAARADRRPGSDLSVEVHRGHPGRSEHQAGPHRKPGLPARRPGRHQGQGPAGRGDAGTPPSSAASPRGTGSYTMEFSHYDIVPGNVQQQIVSKSKMAADEDE